MKYLKPSRLRNAFFRVVALVATVALKVVAPITVLYCTVCGGGVVGDGLKFAG
jgi:hypothetical protein